MKAVVTLTLDKSNLFDKKILDFVFIKNYAALQKSSERCFPVDSASG
jgi:hypothetical protein